jgi:hypothetical protein
VGPESAESATICAIATIEGVGLEQVLRDLCFQHRRWVGDARTAAEKATR